MRARHIRCDVLYLDADEETLLKRFSETRRRHPLTNENRSLAEAIADESLLLGPIIDLADLKIDTTHLNLYQLRDSLKLRLLNQPEPGTAFLVESFGFKRGMPVDADLVFDVRCLPNPYWKPDLRDYSGLDLPVAEYLAAQADVEEMYQDILAYLTKWLPRFAASNRAYVTVAIGCTGGHHRSVYLANRLGEALKPILKNVQVRHRDLS
ncbi:RNase adapter protein RapZ [compost metagenome]